MLKFLLWSFSAPKLKINYSDRLSRVALIMRVNDDYSSGDDDSRLHTNRRHYFVIKSFLFPSFLLPSFLRIKCMYIHVFYVSIRLLSFQHVQHVDIIT